jgi:hypothetical protein
LKVQGSRFKVQGSRLKVQGSRLKVEGLFQVSVARKEILIATGYGNVNQTILQLEKNMQMFR